MWTMECNIITVVNNKAIIFNNIWRFVVVSTNLIICLFHSHDTEKDKRPSQAVHVDIQ